MSSDPRLGPYLLALARQAIARRLGLPEPSLPAPPAAPADPAPTFVTLTKRGALRGCIGCLEPRRSLPEDVATNAQAAAFQDSRFPPLETEEFPDIRIEISRLSPATPLHFKDEAEAMAQLNPGRDGVILSLGGRNATFLPQVWEQLPEPRDFLSHLKRKAGLPADYWSDQLQLARYTVEKWQETSQDTPRRPS
ncbi:MAG: AmmeMemoRadiSam system protein A [Betaproteobacteria bacterium]|nr:AmmeMemoRadiSam system protein A [Betaproteobacteria bacterium]